MAGAVAAYLSKEIQPVFLERDTSKLIDADCSVPFYVMHPEELQAGAHHFNRRSVQVRRKMCWQNCRMNCIIALVILGILSVITIIILGQCVSVKELSPS